MIGVTKIYLSVIFRAYVAGGDLWSWWHRKGPQFRERGHRKLRETLKSFRCVSVSGTQERHPVPIPCSESYSTYSCFCKFVSSLNYSNGLVWVFCGDGQSAFKPTCTIGISLKNIFSSSNKSFRWLLHAYTSHGAISWLHTFSICTWP